VGRKALGELEHFVLVAVVRLGDGADGAAVIDEIERRGGRKLSHAAAYIAMQRLERKGMLTTVSEEPEPGRGGRARRFFAVTEDGLEKLRESASALFGLWEDVDPALRAKGDA
jgi:DNA-binding PadR family transcriptional regulator